jgi:hypothetical protein
LADEMGVGVVQGIGTAQQVLIGVSFKALSRHDAITSRGSVGVRI